MNDRKKIRYAVVGAGHIAQVAVLPAFAHAENSELVALVTGDSEKERSLGERYGVAAYPYEELEKGLGEQSVDAVYVATPNTLHRGVTERAAAAGCHVLCEKPMATTEEDCRAMIGAADSGGVKLMIAYRLHFDDANLRAVELAQSGHLGDPRYFGSHFGMQVEQGNIRLRKDLGGGPLFDIGIYCLNAARYLLRDEPVEVMAYTSAGGEERFAEVEEITGALMRFPGGRIAAFTCSFNSAEVGWYELVGTEGSLRLDPAYTYTGESCLEVTTKGNKETRTFGASDQFAPELIYFSRCILEEKTPEPSGLEGLADVRIINALLASAESGRPVKIKPVEKERRPEPSQEITRPPVGEKPDVVRAGSPHPE